MNKHDDPSFARLDRFMVSTEWMTGHANAEQTALASFTTDHCPGKLHTRENTVRRAMFRFDRSWEDLPRFRERLKET